MKGWHKTSYLFRPLIGNPSRKALEARVEGHQRKQDFLFFIQSLVRSIPLVKHHLLMELLSCWADPRKLAAKMQLLLEGIWELLTEMAREGIRQSTKSKRVWKPKCVHMTNKPSVYILPFNRRKSIRYWATLTEFLEPLEWGDRCFMGVLLEPHKDTYLFQVEGMLSISGNQLHAFHWIQGSHYFQKFLIWKQENVVCNTKGDRI